MNAFLNTARLLTQHVYSCDPEILSLLYNASADTFPKRAHTLSAMSRAILSECSVPPLSTAGFRTALCLLEPL